LGVNIQGSQTLYQKRNNVEAEGVVVRRSKLENYEAILQALVDKYLSVDSLAFNCGMDCIQVNERLGFLVKNGLVEEKQCHNKTLFALTKRGVTVQKTLAITKRLDELKVTVKTVDEELVAVSKFSDDAEEPARHR
jgi:predicted transcriptional regulator